MSFHPFFCAFCNFTFSFLPCAFILLFPGILLPYGYVSYHPSFRLSSPPCVFSSFCALPFPCLLSFSLPTPHVLLYSSLLLASYLFLLCGFILTVTSFFSFLPSLYFMFPYFFSLSFQYPSFISLPPRFFL